MHAYAMWTSRATETEKQRLDDSPTLAHTFHPFRPTHTLGNDTTLEFYNLLGTVGRAIHARGAFKVWAPLLSGPSSRHEDIVRREYGEGPN